MIGADESLRQSLVGQQLLMNVGDNSGPLVGSQLAGGDWNMTFIFHLLRISSPQLTFIFFRGVGQPPTRQLLRVEMRKRHSHRHRFEGTSLGFESKLP